jgi:hypothetical protein
VIELGVTVGSRKLRFGSKPAVEGSFFGSDGYESESSVERRNLPEEVEPGVTYRNVRVDARASVRLPEPSDASD